MRSKVRRQLTTERFLFQRNNLFQDESSTLEPQPDLCPDPGRLPATPLTLFQWQIQQEERRVAGTAAELLGWQDADGDT